MREILSFSQWCSRSTRYRNRWRCDHCIVTKSRKPIFQWRCLKSQKDWKRDKTLLLQCNPPSKRRVR